MSESDSFCQGTHTWPAPGNTTVAIGGLVIQACVVCGALRGVPDQQPHGVTGIRIG